MGKGLLHCCCYNCCCCCCCLGWYCWTVEAEHRCLNWTLRKEFGHSDSVRTTNSTDCVVWLDEVWCLRRHFQADVQIHWDWIDFRPVPRRPDRRLCINEAKTKEKSLDKEFKKEKMNWRFLERIESKVVKVKLGRLKWNVLNGNTPLKLLLILMFMSVFRFGFVRSLAHLLASQQKQKPKQIFHELDKKFAQDVKLKTSHELRCQCIWLAAAAAAAGKEEDDKKEEKCVWEHAFWEEEFRTGRVSDFAFDRVKIKITYKAATTF